MTWPFGLRMSDPISDFKAKQREGWASFAPLEMITTSTAAKLVRFAGVKAGQNVLDVGCGTGVVAITARRLGARVTGLDLTPELLARAKENSSVPGFEDITWREGDVEMLPYDDAAFDVVLSQFGHMFAPRPEVALKEMLRVLRPGGTVAFSTWPPELVTGAMFSTVGKYGPPLPPGASPSSQWGDVAIIRQRLGTAVKDIAFDRATMLKPALSVPHHLAQMEATSGPVRKLVESMHSDPKRLAAFRADLTAVYTPYFDPEQNIVRMDYLMTRAVKV